MGLIIIRALTFYGSWIIIIIDQRITNTSMPGKKATSTNAKPVQKRNRAPKQTNDQKVEAFNKLDEPGYVSFPDFSYNNEPDPTIERENVAPPPSSPKSPESRKSPSLLSTLARTLSLNADGTSGQTQSTNR